jgi:hypothetical protein
MSEYAHSTYKIQAWFSQNTVFTVLPASTIPRYLVVTGEVWGRWRYFIAYNVFQVDQDERRKYLEAYKQRLLNLDITEPILCDSLSDFDENMQLKT